MDHHESYEGKEGRKEWSCPCSISNVREEWEIVKRGRGGTNTQKRQKPGVLDGSGQGEDVHRERVSKRERGSGGMRGSSRLYLSPKHATLLLSSKVRNVTERNA